jgi:DNA polymerase elongation subunit (family B)/DNA-directed RNA polymerase subunit RPC12/RpoP
LKILLLDIETSPNIAHVWGLFNQNISLNQLMESSYMLSFAAKWRGNKKIIFKSVFHDGRQEMLEELWNLLNECDAVIHYNGKRFDIPNCNKEFLLSGMMPPDPYHQIDLLNVSRQKFKFTSNKLEYVAKTLGVGQKIKHAGHELWVKCLAGDAVSWDTMKKYNINDIIILEAVYNRLLPWITDHPSHAVYSDEDRPICTNCGGTHITKQGIETTKTSRYQRYRCEECGTPLRGKIDLLEKEKKKNILTQNKK